LARVGQLSQINSTLIGNNSSYNYNHHNYHNSSNSNTIVQQQQPQPSCSNASVQDVTDDFIVVNNSSNNYKTNDTVNDVPLDHRLPSPEEQCQIIALK
jgi:subtilase family serine protease